MGIWDKGMNRVGEYKDSKGNSWFWEIIGGAIGNLGHRSNRKSGDSIYTSALCQSKVIYEGQVFSLKSLSLFSVAVTKMVVVVCVFKNSSLVWMWTLFHRLPCSNMCSLVDDAVWEGCRTFRRQNLPGESGSLETGFKIFIAWHQLLFPAFSWAQIQGDQQPYISAVTSSPPWWMYFLKLWAAIDLSL